MKKIFVLVVLSFVGTFAFSQGGIFRTFKDFKNGKAEACGEFKHFSGVKNRMTGHFVLNGEKNKIRFKKEKMWGLTTDGENLYRLDPKQRPCLLIETGKIFVWGNWSTKYTKYGMEAKMIDEYPFYYSTSLNGKMIFLHRKTLLKEFEKGSKLYKKLKKDHRGGVEDVLRFIQAYNEGTIE